MIEKLTDEQYAERERFTKQLIDEILNEEAVAELQQLTLEPRQLFDPEARHGYMESDMAFLFRAHNMRAAALLLSVYLRTRD